MLPNLIRDKSYYRRLAGIAVPILIQNLANSALSTAATVMVSGLGELTLSGVSLANSMFNIIYMVGFGIQSGSSVLISQYWGKRDQTSVNRILWIALWSTVLITVPIALSVMLFPRAVLGLFSNDPEIVEAAVSYAVTAAPAFVLNTVSMCYISAQRAMGNSRLGMCVLFGSMSMSVLLNWVLIGGRLGLPAMGIAGAATATLIARALEFIATASYALKTKTLALMPSLALKPGKRFVGEFIKYSVPVILNETLWGAGNASYSVILAHMPSAAAAVAALAVTTSVERILAAFYFSAGSSSGILVGISLGSGDQETGYKAGFTAALLTFACGLAASIVIALGVAVFFEPLIFPLFGLSEEARGIASSMLLTAVVTFPMRAFNYSLVVGILRAGGDVKASMAIDLGAMYFVSIPAACAAAFVFGAGPAFVFRMIALEEAVKFAAGILRFRQKKWVRTISPV